MSGAIKTNQTSLALVHGENIIYIILASSILAKSIHFQNGSCVTPFNLLMMNVVVYHGFNPESCFSLSKK